MIARSYLYVPADNASMLSKAANRGADALIIDFEDSVSRENKQLARDTFIEWINGYEGAAQIWVRVNADSLHADLISIKSARVHGIVVPKATVANMDLVSKLVGTEIRLSALIESADSILNALEIAKVEKVDYLQIGQLDLRAELGLSADSESTTLQYALNHLVLASAAAGIEQPIAPMYRDFNDESGLRASSLQLKADGYFGRTCIHPKQIDVINEIFSTTDSELAEARDVIASLSSGTSVGVDSKGRMIDEASVRIAQRIVRRSH